MLSQILSPRSVALSLCLSLISVAGAEGVESGPASSVPLTAALTPAEIQALNGSAARGRELAQAAAPAQAQSAPAASAAAEPLAKLTVARKDELVTVAGRVSDYRASRSERAPHSFQLTDQAGTKIRVAIWNDVFTQLPAGVSDGIRVGGAVALKAKVAVFRDNVELHVSSAQDIKLTGAGRTAPPAAPPSAPTTGSVVKAPAAPAAGGIIAPGQISEADMGKTVTVRAVVESARRPSSERAPFVLRLGALPGAPAGGIDLVFWANTQKAIPAAHQAEVGDQVEVRGKVGEHRGTLQIQLEGPDAIQVKTRAADGASKPAQPQSAAPAPRPVTVAQLATEATGQRVAVQARVVEASPVRYGNRLVVADSSGAARATVLVYDTALRPDFRPAPGQTLTFEGAVMSEGSSQVLVVPAPR